MSGNSGSLGNFRVRRPCPIASIVVIAAIGPAMDRRRVRATSRRTVFGERSGGLLWTIPIQIVHDDIGLLVFPDPAFSFLCGDMFPYQQRYFGRGALAFTPQPSVATDPSTGSRLKSIIGGSTGNLVEWFDWYVYSAFTLYFAPHFFPSDNKTTELLSAAAVFAVGFVMRPIGAWIMGIYADRHGRKAGLTLSVTLICAGSLIIACTPVYESIGLLAPALLVLARLMQGLSVGGEYGASATYLSEMAGKDRRGFFSSFQYVTLISGQLLAITVLLVLQSMMPKAALEAWGWRIPFFIGAVLAIVVFYLRRGLAETESFKNAKKSDAPK